MDELIKAIADNIPKMNRKLLVDFPEKTISDIPSFIDAAYQNAVKLIPGALKYEGFEILSPEKSIDFILNPRNKKRGISFASSEMILVRYKFRHNDEPKSTVFYVPYMHNDMLVVKGKQYSIILGITEQIYSFIRNTKNNEDGLMIRPMRTRIPFYRTMRLRMVDVGSGIIAGSAFIVTAKLHSKKHGKRKNDTTIILYLLARFGMAGMLSRFGFDSSILSFVTVPDLTDQHHYYFLAEKEIKNRLGKIFLKVRKDDFDSNLLLRKIIANILYTLIFRESHTIKDICDPSRYLYRVILGRIIYPEFPAIKACTEADTHLESVDVFIDPITRKRFNDFGMKCDNIYDVLVRTFMDIDSIITNSVNQNLYNKRVDITDGITIPSFATGIFRKFYSANQRSVLQEREVDNLMRISSTIIEVAWSANTLRRGRNVNPSPQRYNDSWLVSCGIFKIRASGSSTERFDTSMAVVESITSFSGGEVGSTGRINPFCQINESGGITRPHYADLIDSLAPFLPQA